jgi:hypothetical protein
MTKRRPGTVIVSLLAVAGGVFLFRMIRGARRTDRDEEERLDCMLDGMLEQSFPASDAPAY